MAKLIKCQDCSHMIPYSDSDCPMCGKHQDRGWRGAIRAGLMLFLIGMLVQVVRVLAQ